MFLSLIVTYRHSWVKFLHKMHTCLVLGNERSQVVLAVWVVTAGGLKCSAQTLNVVAVRCMYTKYTFTYKRPYDQSLLLFMLVNIYSIRGRFEIRV